MSKHFPILIPVILILSIILSSCSSSTKVEPDTPTNTAFIMKNFIDAGNYEGFKELLSEGRKNAISQEIFESFKGLTSAGSSYVHYELIRFDNGKMLLVRLTPDKVKGKYYIENVVAIPAEMKKFFED